MAGFATGKEAKEASIRLIRERQPSFPGRHAVTFSLGESEHWAEAEHVRGSAANSAKKAVGRSGRGGRTAKRPRRT